MGDPQLLFLRDLADVEPPRDRYAHYEEEDIYRLVPRPQWTGLEDEIWTPRSQEHDPQLEKVKALMKRNSDGEQGAQMGQGTNELPSAPCPVRAWGTMRHSCVTNCGSSVEAAAVLHASPLCCALCADPRCVCLLAASAAGSKLAAKLAKKRRKNPKVRVRNFLNTNTVLSKSKPDSTTQGSTISAAPCKYKTPHTGNNLQIRVIYEAIVSLEFCLQFG